MKKSVKLACHVVAISSLPTLQISLGIVALFDSGPILTVVLNIGEDVQYNTVVSIKCFM